MNLEGKVSVVVGGGSGIGKAVATTLLQKGAKVCIADVDEETGNEVAENLKKEHPDSVIFKKCDVRSQEEVNNVFSAAEARFGKKVEVAVLTAAIIDETNWELCVDVNIGGAIRFMTGALGHIGKDEGGQGGSVIFTSSLAGVHANMWGPVYGASKHAIIGLARSWAEPENFKTHGVRINCICPSATETPFLQQVTKARHVEWHQNRLKTAPIFSPEEVVPSYLQLIEDDTLNGQALMLSRDRGIEMAKFQGYIHG